MGIPVPGSSRSSKNFTSLNNRLLLTGLSTLLVFTILLSLGSYAIQNNQINESLHQELEDISSRLSRTLITPVWNLDPEYMEAMIETEMANRDLVAIKIRDQSGSVNYAMVRTAQGLSFLEGPAVSESNASSKVFARQVRTISRNSKTLGTVEVEIGSEERYKGFFGQVVLLAGAAISICTLVILVFTWAIRTQIIERIMKLTTTVQEFGTTGYQVRAGQENHDEIGILAISFNRMADTLANHALELESLVQERTRQLVESEKLSFMGKMVAGFAHELNTPLGVCTTASSFLDACYRDFKNRLENTSLTRGQTDQFIKDSMQALGMIRDNLSKASELVHTFKGIGSDQESGESRVFNLSEYLDSILVVLRPKMKHSPHKLEVKVAPGLLINAQPGLFYQVLSQLLTNSLVHAFEIGQAGTMYLTAYRNERGLILEFEDNGKGMNKEQLENLFTPLYTTRRGQGNLGLGLYITWTMVRKQGGTLEYSPRQGGGSIFTVTLPKTVFIA